MSYCVSRLSLRDNDVQYNINSAGLYRNKDSKFDTRTNSVCLLGGHNENSGQTVALLLRLRCSYQSF